MSKPLGPLDILDAAIVELEKAAQEKSDDEREDLDRILNLIRDARGMLARAPNPYVEKWVIFITRLFEMLKVAGDFFLRCKWPLSFLESRVYIQRFQYGCR